MHTETILLLPLAQVDCPLKSRAEVEVQLESTAEFCGKFQSDMLGLYYRASLYNRLAYIVLEVLKAVVHLCQAFNWAYRILYRTVMGIRT